VQHNGLPAESFAPVADVAPGVVDAVLAALRTAGVAAYVVPGDPPAADGNHQLWVDTAATSSAREVLAAMLEPGEEPDPAPVSVRSDDPSGRVVDDADWAEIVASYYASPDTYPAPPPSAGSTPRVPPRPGRVLRRAQPEPEREPGAAAADDQPEPWDPSPEPPDEGKEPAAHEEHFEPPAPPPLPSGDTVSRFAWAGLLLGPAYLLLCVLVGWAIPGWAGALALGAFVAGFVTLVARMRDDEGPRDDNGAVV